MNQLHTALAVVWAMLLLTLCAAATMAVVWWKARR